MAPSLSAEDRLALEEHYARYAWAIDTGDVERCAALFLPDGALVHGEQPFHGHDEIRQHLRDLTTMTTWAGGQHHIGQLLFLEAGDTRCRVKSYGRVTLRRRDGTMQFRAFGLYRDTCVKVDGAWLFEERRWESWEPDGIAGYRQ